LTVYDVELYRIEGTTQMNEDKSDSDSLMIVMKEVYYVGLTKLIIGFLDVFLSKVYGTEHLAHLQLMDLPIRRE
jgi:hypothetical protein